MPSTVLVGAQWGDEGKGKITDLIASDYDYVVRFQGGNNAGHTVIHGDKKLALHLMPSGVMYENAVPVIGNGVVVDPGVLVKEMAMLEAEGISCKNLKISNDAHLIMPYHKDLDGADEKSLGDKKIGTTKRGIGPCYQDKMGRKGIRMQDLLDEKIFRLKLEAALAQKNPILEKIYGLHTYTVEEICDEYLPYARILAPYVCESAHMLNEALGDGKSILFEGAQGTLLDIDHGTYPFVTSSSCCAGGASTGTGVGPKAIDRVLGIQKAYVTRVGEGPFPTELKFPENGGTGQDAEDGELLCAAGHEFGVTTGRKRRCGWFDGPIAEGVVSRYLEPLFEKSPAPDCLVLGCTHYPMLAAAIRKVVGPEVHIVDSAATTAEVVKRRLTDKGLAHPQAGRTGRIRFFITDDPQRFTRTGSLFLNMTITDSDVRLVDLENVPLPDAAETPTQRKSS